MIKSGSASRLPVAGAKIQFLARFTWIFGLVAAVLVTVAATPPPNQQIPDEQYIQIMTMIDKADALQAAGQLDAAKAKYKEAQKALIYFRAANPLFDPKTVTYRLNEVTDKVEARPPITESATPEPKPKPKLEAEGAAAAKGAVKLLDPGLEPRTVLRLHAKAGDKQTVIMTIKMTMEMPGAGGGAPATTNGGMKIPAMTIPMDVTIQNVAANGDITYEAVIGEAGIAEEPGIAPQIAQAMKAAIGGIKGMTCAGVMSNRGISKKVDVKAPPSADPQVRQSVEQIREGMANLGMALPEAAVGAGAKWEVEKTVKSQGMSIDEKDSYQLVSVEGDHVNATFTIAQNAAHQKIQIPAAPGAQVNLIQMTGNATGSVNTDLSKLVASQATMDMHTDSSMEVAMGNKKQPMEMKMGMNMVIEAK